VIFLSVKTLLLHVGFMFFLLNLSLRLKSCVTNVLWTKRTLVLVRISAFLEYVFGNE
jgi:hypothetical protein